MKHGWHHGTQWNTVQIYSLVLKAVWYFERGQLRDQQMLTLLRSVVIFFSFVHPCLPLYLLFFFWRSCVARIYCFARPNRGACSQAILGEKGELWGERYGRGELCRGLRRPDHSLSPAFFLYFALRLLLAIFPLKEALSQVNSNQEWPGPNRSKPGTLFLSGLLLGFSFTKVLLCVFAPSCMS